MIDAQKMRILLIALSLVIGASNLWARTFHVLLVADTQDKRIGVAVEESMRNYEKPLSYLSTVSGIHHRIRLFDSNNWTIQVDTY